MCDVARYSKNIAEKRSTPVYADALALLAQTTTDAISLEYAQPGHSPDLLANAGDKTVILGVLNLDTEAPVETVDEIVARANRFLKTLTQVTTRYGRQVNTVESADLRHENGYAIRLRGVSTLSADGPKK